MSGQSAGHTGQRHAPRGAGASGEPVTEWAAMPDRSVSSRIASRIVDAVAARGHDAAVLCTRAGVDLDVVRDVSGRVDAAGYLALWREAVAMVGDTAFALQVAEAGESTPNLLRFVCMPSRDVREALDKASRYLGILTDAAQWTVAVEGDEGVVAVDRGGFAPEGARFAAEFSLAEIVALGRAFTGVAWRPTSVHFAHDEPEDCTALRAFFGAPLHFRGARSELRIPTTVLDLPLQRTNPAEASFFEEYAARLLRGAAPQDTTSYALRAHLVRTIAGSWPTLETAASSLAMSPRTLRRKLQAEGTSYQEIVDELRFETAKKHIREGHLSFAELAVLLGFSELSAFHRAFRRWSGTTPQRYARENGRRVSGSSSADRAEE